MGLFTKLFGTRSEREVKKLEPQVEAVMALEEPYKKPVSYTHLTLPTTIRV